MDVNYCPIFVSSSDVYSDIWPAFFKIFKREWPEYKGIIYLNTEKKDFSFEGLNIKCTKVALYQNLKFGETFKRGIEKIDNNHFLLFMIDYFIENRVNTAYLQSLYNEFISGDPESLFLMPLGPKSTSISNNINIVQMNIPESNGIAKESIFSFQIAFWRKEHIGKYIMNWEDPWFAEYFGCRRAKILTPKFWMLSPRLPLPIKYDGRGVLHGGGKWLESAISRIDLTNIPLNLNESKSIRGIFTEPAFPRIVRIPREIRLIPERMKSMHSIYRLKRNLKTP